MGRFGKDRGSGFGGRSSGFGDRKESFGGHSRRENNFGSDRREGRGHREFEMDEGPRRRLEMFPAICDKCGKECELPFKPTSRKPVYCSDCFRDSDKFEVKERPGSNTEALTKINEKLDKIMRAMNLD